jgi:hypothetical protein
MNRNIFLGILLTLFSIITYNSSSYTNYIVYAHNFSITDDSAFLTLIEQIKAETELVNVYFLASNNSSVIEHTKNAANLTNGLNDKLRQSTVADITQVYTNGLYNSTTLALVVANLVDEILRNYGSAYGVTYDLTNMSNMMTASDMVGKTNHSMLAGSQHSAGPEFVRDNDLVLVNPQDYQTATTLSSMVDRLFNDDLAHLSPDNETSTVVKLVESIRRLRDSVDNRVSPGILMDIVHTQVHPLLLKAYHLRLIST